MAETTNSDNRKENTIENNRETEKKVYEATFHIVPTLTSEEVKAEFDVIKKIILDKEESEFISEGLPTIRNLEI